MTNPITNYSSPACSASGPVESSSSAETTPESVESMVTSRTTITTDKSNKSKKSRSISIADADYADDAEDSGPIKKAKKGKRKKTKTGCLTCKARKIKCDEGKPICDHCLKRRVTCIFPRIPSAASKDSPNNNLKDDNSSLIELIPREHKPTTSDGALSQEGVDYLMGLVPGSQVGVNNKDSVILASQKVENFDVFSSLFKMRNLTNYRLYSQLNFQFVDYYTTQYYMKLSRYYPVQKAFLNIFSHSFNYPHLIHIILALISLDFYNNASKLYVHQNKNRLSLRPKVPDAKVIMNREAYLKLSEFEQTKSLELFTKHLTPKTPQESMTSLLASVFQFVYYMFSPNYKMIDSGFFSLASGVDIIYRGSKEFFSSQDVIPLESLIIVAKSKPCSRDDIGKAFTPAYLYGLLEPADFEENNSLALRRLKERYKVYESAIKALLNCYTEVNKPHEPERDFLNILIRWTIDHALPFRSLVVEERDARVLIIMAHFIMLLSSMIIPEYWSQDTFVDEIDNIADVLYDCYGDCWLSWLNVPKVCVYQLATRDVDDIQPAKPKIIKTDPGLSFPSSATP